jgi:hypothetical protein
MGASTFAHVPRIKQRLASISVTGIETPNLVKNGAMSPAANSWSAEWRWATDSCPIDPGPHAEQPLESVAALVARTCVAHLYEPWPHPIGSGVDGDGPGVVGGEVGGNVITRQFPLGFLSRGSLVAKTVPNVGVVGNERH